MSEREYQALDREAFALVEIGGSGAALSGLIISAGEVLKQGMINELHDPYVSNLALAERYFHNSNLALVTLAISFICTTIAYDGFRRYDFAQQELSKIQSS